MSMDASDIFKFNVIQRSVAIGYDLVLLMGQSNKSGRGTPFSVPNTDPVDPRIYQYGNSGTYVNQISMAVEPLAMHDIPSGIGPGLVFARWYVQTLAPSRRVLLVPVAHGGTGFGHDGGYTWLPGDLSVSNLFENAISQAQAALAAAGPNSRIVAATWLQGETDGSNNVPGATYQANLDLLITTLRSRLSLPNLPFIVAQMVPEYLGTGTRAQVNAVHIDTPRRQLYAGFSYGAVGQNMGDGNHFNAVGQRINGMNMFDAYRRALANTLGVNPVAVSPVSVVQSGTSINVSWPRPYCRVTDYPTEYSTDGGATWSPVARTQGLDPTAVVTGMTLGATVNVRVSTTNEAGSVKSAPAQITLATLPGQVTGLNVPAPTQTVIAPSWSAVAGGNQYQVQYKRHADSTWTNGPLTVATNATLVLPLSSTQYDVQVYAVNAAGNGAPSATATITTGVAAGVLDSLSASAWGAYGTRKLRTAYAGAAIQVRRSSDNTTQNIGFVAGSIDLDTASLLTFVGSGSGYITTFYDQSGNGRDLAQATVANQPRIVNAGVLDAQGANSRPAPYFDGAASYLTRVGAGLYAAGSSSTVGVVRSQTAGASRYVVMEGSTASGNQQYVPVLEDSSTGANLIGFIRNDGNGVVYNFISGYPPAAFDGSLHQYETDDSGTGITTTVDGTQTVSIGYTRSGTLTLTNFSVGAAVRNTVSNWFNGNIPELLVFAGQIGATDKAAIRADEKNYYGTA